MSTEQEPTQIETLNDKGNPTGGQPLSDRKRSLVFINLVVTAIASSGLGTAVTTAIAPISASFGISASTGQWMMSGYTLTMGIIMPLSAFMIKRFPTKRLYQTGLCFFAVGLVVSMLSVNFPMMIMGRVIQACGGGIVMAMAQVIVLSIYPYEKRGSAMGTLGLAQTAAPVVAPTLGGICVDTLGWRAIFGFVLIIMLASLVLSFFVMANVLETKKIPFDFSSFILSIFTFGGLTLGIGNVGTYGITSLLVYPFLIVGAVAAVFFVYRQIHLDTPFLDVKMFKTRGYAFGVIGCMLTYFVMMGSIIIMPLYVQSIMGYSATIAGIVTLPGSLLTAVISPLAGRIYDRVGIKRLLPIGVALLFIGSLYMVFISMDTSIIMAAVANAVRCAGIGFLMMPLLTWSVSNIKSSLVADATAFLNSLTTITGSIGSAVLVAIMTSVAARSASTYGADASMHGLNITFLVMTFFVVAMAVVIVFCIRCKKPVFTEDGETVEEERPLLTIMKKDVYTIDGESSLLDAIDLITEKKVSGVPVTDDNGKMIGFISDGDIMHLLGDQYQLFTGTDSYVPANYEERAGLKEKAESLLHTKVKELAKKHVITVDADQDLGDICRILSEYHIKKAPVMNDGKMIGVINRSNIMKYILTQASR